MNDRKDTAMQEQARETEETTSPAPDEEEQDEVSSPFDHPAFLPVLLFGMMIWFGYDGWFSETIESVRFNRYGFFFLLGAALYFTASELLRVPFLLAGLFLAYAVWLGLFHLLGSPDAWWKNDPAAAGFNRYGAIACLVLAAGSAFREWRRGSPETVAG